MKVKRYVQEMHEKRVSEVIHSEGTVDTLYRRMYEVEYENGKRGYLIREYKVVQDSEEYTKGSDEVMDTVEMDDRFYGMDEYKEAEEDFYAQS